MSVRSTKYPRYLGIGALVASAAIGVSFGGTSTAYAAPKAPSAPSAVVANNTLTITGTDGPDQITLAGSNDDPNALDIDLGNGTRERFDRTTFNAISVFLGNGDDQFTEPAGVFADETLTVDAGSGDDHIVTGDGNDTIFAGDGNDTVLSGKGDDLVFGDNGDDFVDGQFGHDTAFLGDGHDSFQWDPGDGSDAVDGGRGNDTLVFNGAAASETMSLSANGDRAVFLRDPGTVRMDMNDVEQLQVNALGGADNITVNDMHGTGLRDAEIDLGAGDHAADVVTLNGTDGRDNVHVGTQQGQVSVRGLEPETHISGSEPGDTLQVNTLGGDDRVHLDNDVSAVIGVHTDLGADQH